MYCRIENNIIHNPQALPKQFGNVLGCFDKLSDEELKEYNFYPYVAPEYDPGTHLIGELTFDNGIVTRRIVEINFRQRNEETGNKLLSGSDWTQLPDALKYGRISNYAVDQFGMWRERVYRLKNSNNKVDWDEIIKQKPSRYE